FALQRLEWARRRSLYARPISVDRSTWRPVRLRTSRPERHRLLHEAGPHTQAVSSAFERHVRDPADRRHAAVWNRAQYLRLCARGNEPNGDRGPEQWIDDEHAFGSGRRIL